MTHLIALQADRMVDTSTRGKVVALKDAVVPDDFNEFRIKRVFQITH